MSNINTWPGWKFVKKIGGGSYGKVYEIEKEVDGVLRKAALKVISVPPEQEDIGSAEDAGYYSTVKGAEAFWSQQIDKSVQEFTTMSKLSGCRNIVACEDYAVIPHDGWAGSDILIRMELLTSLTKYQREHSMDESDIIKLGLDICSALTACQDLTPPILHRDIKPANIMVDDDGNFKLGDFGVARAMEGTKSAHTTAGTDAYMAPEVRCGKGYFATADIYSLGMVLYRFLNKNRSPFLPVEGDLTSEMYEEAEIRRQRGDKIPNPQSGSDMLKAVVLKAIAFKPSDRYQTAAEFSEALKHCPRPAGPTMPEAVPVSAPAPVEKTLPSDLLHEGSVPSVDDDPVINVLNSDPVPDENTVPSSLPQVNPVSSSAAKPKSKKPFIIAAVILVLAIGIACFGWNRHQSQLSATEVSPAETATVETDAVETDAAETTASTSMAASNADSGAVIQCDNTEIAVGEVTDVAMKVDTYLLRSNTSLKWSSDNENVATVSEDGTVTGISEGTANITGYYHGKTASVEITVTASNVTDNSASEPSSLSGTNADSTESPEIRLCSDTILAGDSIQAIVRMGNSIITHTGTNAVWTTSDTNVAAVDESGIITAKAAGNCTITLEYEGKSAEKKITVVEVDNASGATITADYEKIGLSKSSEFLITLTIDGNVPEHYGGTAYYSNGLFLSLQWGEVDGNTIPLTINDAITDEGEGDITVLLYDESNPSHIVASEKIHVKIG